MSECADHADNSLHQKLIREICASNIEPGLEESTFTDSKDKICEIRGTIRKTPQPHGYRLRSGVACTGIL